METASSYFTKRARQERTSAVDAASAEARGAHLELAFRLVRAATEPPLVVGCAQRAPGRQGELAQSLGRALRSAFPLREAAAFEQLIDALN